MRLGGIERSGKGSHRVVNMPNGRNLSVPSDVVKLGLLRHLVAMAEVGDGDFLAAAGR